MTRRRTLTLLRGVEVVTGDGLVAVMAGSIVKIIAGSSVGAGRPTSCTFAHRSLRRSAAVALAIGCASILVATSNVLLQIPA